MKITVAQKIGLNIRIDMPGAMLTCFIGNVAFGDEVIGAKLQVDRIVATVWMILLDNKLLQHDFIIGTDYLNQDRVKIIKEGHCSSCAPH